MCILIGGAFPRYCSAYLAFKIEEYNLSIDEFLHMLQPDQRQYVGDLVLSKEVCIHMYIAFYIISVYLSLSISLSIYLSILLQ